MPTELSAAILDVLDIECPTTVLLSLLRIVFCKAKLWEEAEVDMEAKIALESLLTPTEEDLPETGLEVAHQLPLCN